MDKENAACNFRDERLKKRFRLLFKQLWTNMGQSVENRLKLTQGQFGIGDNHITFEMSA